MASDTITLFDIPTKAPQRCWSYNTWRTRILLNYKGLDYKTEWTEYPDIRPTLEPHVAPDNEGDFTCPAIKLPDGTYIMDSKKIAPVILEKYPSPALRLESPLQAEFIPKMVAVMIALREVYVVQVSKSFLSDASLPYFRKTRAKDLGMSLEQCDKENPRDKAFEKAVPAMKEVSELLRKNGGPFLEGEEFVYTDVYWAGVLLFFKEMGEDMWEDFLRSTGDREVHEKFLKALEPWTKRNDY